VDHSADRWVQRLRDGDVPPTWRIVVVTVLISLVGAVLLWQLAARPETTQSVVDSLGRSALLAFVVPVILLVTGPGVALAAWSAGRRDRRTLARIHAAGGRPTFHLPVASDVAVAGEEFADPKPVIWTVDHSGLHGWSPDHARPVHELAWGRVHAFGLATTMIKGQRQDWGIWVSTSGGHVVLVPRTTLCRPFGAGRVKRAVLVGVLRRLRDELDPADVARAS
jgi:hypothetical protein